MNPGVAPQDLALRCRCGAVQGVALAITPGAGNHAVCYCDDCQAFAHALGRTADVLDASGGTEIFQMSPAQLHFTAGADRLACLRLTPSGPLRWYTSCCNTPIGNTLASGRLPFIGLIRTCIAAPADDVATRAALGPIRGRVFRQFALGDPAAVPSGGVPMWRLVARVARLILKWRLRGDQTRSPFFDAATAKPIALPRVLTASERAALPPRT
jgi:hypothetical protein